MPHRTALVVEDEIIVLQLLQESLEDLHFEVSGASNRDQLDVALERLGDLDVLVTDIRLPGITGYEVAQRVRARHPNCAIVFLSGSLPEIETRPERSVYIQKPFGLTGLPELIQALLP